MSGADVFITNTAVVLPNAPVGNDQMERILGQAGGRPSRARRATLRSNGIQTRHYAIDPETLRPTHTNASLTAAAVRGLADQHFDLRQLDCLACGTSIPDQLLPNHASMVQGELGLSACETVATAGVCLSGLMALKYAWLAVSAGVHRNAIATGSELSSAVLTASNFQGETEAQADALEERPELSFEKDFLRWMLSDGAGAVLLEPAARTDRPSLRIDWIDVLSYAGEMETCMYAGAIKEPDGSITGWARLTPEHRERQSVMVIKQEVRLLNENIILYSVEKPLLSIIEKRGLRASAIDYFLPHYSSEYFRDRLHAGLRRADLDIPQDRWFSNLATRGNIGAASIYTMLDDLMRSGRLRPKERLLCFVPESSRFATGFMHLTVV